MKKKKILLIGICILLIICIAALAIFFISNQNKEIYDKTIDKDGTKLIINKEKITNDSIKSYKKGKRVNIIIKKEDSKYDNGIYMENVLISDIDDNNIALWVPTNYYLYTQSFKYIENISFKIAKPTNKKGPFKGNSKLQEGLREELYNNNNFIIPEENNN